MKTKTTVWNAVDHLKTKADREAYLNAAFEDGDAAVIAAALGDVSLTKSYTETVLKRIREDSKFAAALYDEAIDAILSGEREEGLMMIRDIVNADVGFPRLAKHINIPEKSLHRMLSRRGNPSVGVFGRIAKGMRELLAFAPTKAVACL